MLIARERQGSLIAFACACVAHAGLVAWMSHVDVPTSARPPVASRGPAPAPLIVVPPEPQSAPIGQSTGEGEAIARVDLPSVARRPGPHEIDQAWTRQRPTLSPPPTPRQDTSSPLGPSAPTQFPPPRPLADVAPIAPDRAEARSISAPTPQLASEPKPLAAAPQAPPDPADAGPSDLDPFAKAEGVDFTPGGIEARTGRPVKLVRPRVDLGYLADATALRGRKTTILLKIETDAEGTPTRVDIVRSTGSTQIDDAIRLAMFSSHFGGKMPDAFPFGITLWQ